MSTFNLIMSTISCLLLSKNVRRIHPCNLDPEYKKRFPFSNSESVGDRIRAKNPDGDVFVYDVRSIMYGGLKQDSKSA
jgi:hypothetical protein